jgi:hypothetical protein
VVNGLNDSEDHINPDPTIEERKKLEMASGYRR